jgi:hypothetical protein
MIIQETCKLIQNIDILTMAFYHLEKIIKKTIAQIMTYFQQAMVQLQGSLMHECKAQV